MAWDDAALNITVNPMEVISVSVNIIIIPLSINIIIKYYILCGNYININIFLIIIVTPMEVIMKCQSISTAIDITFNPMEVILK